MPSRDARAQRAGVRCVRGRALPPAQLPLPLLAWPGPVLHSRAFCTCSVTSSEQQKRPGPREQPRRELQTRGVECPLPSLEGLCSPKSYSEAFRPDSGIAHPTQTPACPTGRKGDLHPCQAQPVATQFLPHTTASQFYLCPSPCMLPRGDSGTPRNSPPPTHTPSAGISRPRGAGDPSPSAACAARQCHAATHFRHTHTCRLKITCTGPGLDKCSSQHFPLVVPEKLTLVCDMLEAFFLVIFKKKTPDLQETTHKNTHQAHLLHAEPCGLTQLPRSRAQVASPQLDSPGAAVGAQRG